MNKKTIKIIAIVLVFAIFVLTTGCVSQNEGGKEGFYTVTFDYGDSISRNRAVEVEKGEKVDLPDEPVRKGYVFAGWYSEETSGEKIEFPYVPTQNMTVYGHWTPAKFNVTFDLNYENSTDFLVLEAEYKQSIDEPEEIPLRDGYVFRYWSITPQTTIPSEFPYEIRKDTIFYASWRDAEISVFDVTLHYGDYEGAPKDLVYKDFEAGEALQQSQAVSATRRGYELLGWSTSPNGEVVQFPYYPTGETTLYAVWRQIDYTLRYMYNYPDSPTNVYVSTVFHYLDSITEPVAPSRPNYVFEGWYTAEVGGNRVNFPVTASYRNATYYAHWVSNPVTTDIFHAEYIAFDPSMEYPGLSGSAKGAECIVPVSGNGVLIDNYPANSAISAGQGFCVSYQYTRTAVMRFEITAEEEISGASLIANWATERDLTFGPDGENAYVVTVNGTPVNYTPIAMQSNNGAMGTFKEYVLSSGITLRKGINVIIMYPDNDNGTGTMQCSAPITDYIRFSYTGSGKLSWRPIYDNLNGRGF